MTLTSTLIAAGCGSTQLRAASWLAPLQTACDRFGINTPLSLAAFLATVGVESGRLVFTREIWGPTPAQQAYEPPSKKAVELGNVAAGDGRRFCGRGLIQVTGRSNYEACGKALGIDLINHPELLEQSSDAALSAAWYWSTHGLSALADAGNFLGVSRAVNLGNANSKAMPNGYSERLALYAAGKKALGL